MTRYLTVLVFVLSSGCSGVVVPSVDSGAPAGDGGVCYADLYNASADRMGCERTAVCPACPVLINSGGTCDLLARALEPCPDGDGGI
jgi:hypothetical protein